MSYLTDIRLTIRALVKLNMSDNNFYGAEAGKILGDMLAANTVLKELDISGGEYESQKCDVEFFKGFSPGLGANAAATKDVFTEAGLDDDDAEMRGPGVEQRRQEFAVGALHEE